MALLDLFPARVRFTDKDGRLTPEAMRALAALFVRVGGASALSNTELAMSDDDDSGLEELKAELAKSLDAFAMQPRSELDPFTDPLQPIAQEHSGIEHVLTELAGLREQVAALQTQINDLQQGAIYDGNS
jgi:hypothetical protein